MVDNVYQEIMDTYIGTAQPDHRYDQSYAIIVDSVTPAVPYPPSMEKIEFQHFGAGIVDIR